MVQDYLLKASIAPERIQILSKGEEEPAEPGYSEEAWAQNWRVDFKIME